MSELIWDQAALFAVLNSPSGFVARDLARRAVLVESEAKRIASQPPPSRRGTGPSVRTGRLRSSITWALGEDSGGIYADIGTNVEYAPYLEDPDILDRRFLLPALKAGAI